MLTPPTVTARLVGFRRSPWQSGHSTPVITPCISSSSTRNLFRGSGALRRLSDDAFKSRCCMSPVSMPGPSRSASCSRLFAAGTVQKRMHAFRRHVLDFGVQRKTVFFAQALAGAFSLHRTVRIIPAACLAVAPSRMERLRFGITSAGPASLHKGTEARACLRTRRRDCRTRTCAAQARPMEMPCSGQA